MCLCISVCVYTYLCVEFKFWRHQIQSWWLMQRFMAGQGPEKKDCQVCSALNRTILLLSPWFREHRGREGVREEGREEEKMQDQVKGAMSALAKDANGNLEVLRGIAVLNEDSMGGLPMLPWESLHSCPYEY